MMHENLSQEAAFLDAVQLGDVRKVQAFLADNSQMAFRTEIIEKAVGIAVDLQNSTLSNLLLEAQTESAPLQQHHLPPLPQHHQRHQQQA